MKKLTLVLIISMLCTPLFAYKYKHSRQYSEEIMGQGKVLHVNDKGVFFMRYEKKLHVCIPSYYLDNRMRPDLLKVNCTGVEKGTE